MAEENTEYLITAGDEEFMNVVNSSAASSVSDNTEKDRAIDSYHGVDRSISNSAEKQKSSNKCQRRIPNYLRASTGSCHDLCKYGRRTTFEEEKPWKSTLRRPAKSSLNKFNSADLTTSSLERKEKFGMRESSEGTKGRISSEANGTGSYSPEVKLCSNTRNDPKLKTSSNAKSHFIAKGKHALSGKEAHNLRRNKSSPTEKFPPLDPPEIIKKEITAEKAYDQPLKLLSSAESKHEKVRSPSRAYSSDGMVMKGIKNPDAKTGRTMTASRDFGKKVSAPLTSKVVKLNGRKKAEMKDNKVSERTLHIVKTGSSNTTSEPIADKSYIAPLQSSLSTVEPSSSLLVYEDGEVMKGTDNGSDSIVPDVPVEIDNMQLVKEKQSKTMLRKSRKLVVAGDKYSSLVKSKLTTGKAVDRKKIQSRSANTINIKADKDVKPVNTAKEQPIKVKQKRPLKRSGLVISEDKHLPAVRLKFRSGRVVNVPQDSNNIPRRLKFRRPKPLNDDADKCPSQRNEHELISDIHNMKQNDGKLLRKSKVVGCEEKLGAPVRIYKSGKAVDPPSDNDIAKRLRFKKVRIPRIEGAGKVDPRIRTFRTVVGKDITIGAEISGRKLALKHQRVQAKKDAQVLLNNVIEETASKLVESRKSKVKALVGAFETVISLQEGKTRSHIAN